MQHLVDDHAIGALILQRQRVHVALPQAGADARRLQLHARQPKHLRRSVDADRIGRARGEQLDHPPGAGADIDEPPERPLAKRAVDRLLDIASATWSERILSQIPAWALK